MLTAFVGRRCTQVGKFRNVPCFKQNLGQIRGDFSMLAFTKFVAATATVLGGL